MMKKNYTNQPRKPMMGGGNVGMAESAYGMKPKMMSYGGMSDKKKGMMYGGVDKK